MSLLYRAVDQGLLVHPMAGWKEGPLRVALGLPEDFTPAAVVAVGYAGKSSDLDEAARKKEEKPWARKPLGEVAFRSRSGEPFEATLPSRPAKVYETELQLRFGDTDAMGHVNNAKVVTYLELGRVRSFADVMGAERVEDIRFILAEVSCRYRIPILLHDRVFVRMHITEVHRSSFRFRCDLYDPRDGRVFVEAETVQVMYDYTTGALPHRRRFPLQGPGLHRGLSGSIRIFGGIRASPHPLSSPCCPVGRAGGARTAAKVPSCRRGKAAPRTVARGMGRGTRAR